MPIEERLLARYRRLGIDVNNPNPDGSDYHLMNHIDDMSDEEWAAFIARQDKKREAGL